jgi:hypothetical protein
VKKITALLVASLFAVTALCSPVFADQDPICSQPGVTDEQKELAGCNTGDPGEEAFSTVRNVLSAVYVAVGIAAVGVIIFGGFRYTVSQGDPGKVKRAKDTIMYALIGLIIVLSAFAITNFILSGIL